jgi:pyridoxal phosphate enzyme (YggS family)
VVDSSDHVPANLAAVRARLERAARAAGRSAGAIRLVAVSKTFPIEHIRAAFGAGQLDFGENRVQEALQKIESLSDVEIRWHLVGHLQANKARRAASAFQYIHSIDSLDLLRRIDRAAEEAGAAPELLVQVDLASEPTKFGIPEVDVRAIFEADLHAARLRGLMVLPPWTENPEEARPWFRRLRSLRDLLESEGIPADSLQELSMGMSHDFEVAIQEGSTMVRIGTAIFGERRREPGTENNR